MTLSKKQSNPSVRNHRAAQKKILDWYRLTGRDVPWRVKKGAHPNPYKIWLSEIMCQQTTVQAVKPFYKHFIERWPTVAALAKAPSTDVMEAWAGLGYYARARNLHRCAQIIVSDYDGEFPSNLQTLKTLPGIGEYTGAALAAIAFGQDVPVVDGNVERVMARYYAIERPLPDAKPLLRQQAKMFYQGAENYSDMAQALMDLGALVCIPKTPRCTLCPLQHNCKGLLNGRAAQLPIKITAKARPKRFGYVYWITNEKKHVLTHRREERGLLPGMLSLPTSDWVDTYEQLSHLKIFETYEITEHPDKAARISHTFSHFDLELQPFVCRSSKKPRGALYAWEPIKGLGKRMPSVFGKAFDLYTKS